MIVNSAFFIIRISKDLQREKRKKIKLSNVGYLGIKYSEQERPKQIPGPRPVESTRQMLNFGLAERQKEWDDANISTSGFRVLNVEPESPAFHAGFTAGDIITAINGQAIKSFTEMITLVGKNPPGVEVEISYINSFSIEPTISIKKVVLGEKPLYLDIPDGEQDMRFNLQFGDVVMIGTKAHEMFPEVQLGDRLLVHHSVEYKQRAEGDKNWNDWHLVEEDKKFEYRLAHYKNEVLGVWNTHEPDISKAIIPYPTFVFCHEHIKKSSLQMVNGIWLPDAWEASSEDMANKLEELKFEIDELNTSSIMHKADSEHNYKQKAEIKKAIDKINEERKLLTKKMHQKRLVEATVLYVNPKTNDQYLSDLEPGDKIVCDFFTLYPLDVFGAHYSLARPQMINLHYKNT